jgi:hypothetical protein
LCQQTKRVVSKAVIGVLEKRILALQRMTEMKPMPPTAPTVPVFSTHASHPRAKTGIHPLVTKAWTRMNIQKAKGTSAKGSEAKTVEAVGKSIRNDLYRAAMRVVSMTDC